MAAIDRSDNPPAAAGGGFEDFVEDDGLDLRHYWHVLLRYRWGILGLVVAVGLFTTVWAYSLQPIYRATATVLIGGGDAVTGSSQDQAGLDKAKFLGTQYELLRSREVAKAALEGLGDGVKDSIRARLQRDARSGFDWRDWVPRSWLETAHLDRTPIPESDPDKALLAWVRGHLQAQPVRDTAMVKVSFESTSAPLAAQMANAITQAYINYNLRRRLVSTAEASQWLQQQLKTSQQRIDDAVNALQRYWEEAGLEDVEGLRAVQTQQLGVLATELSAAHRARADAEHLYQRAKRLRASGQMDAIPEVLSNPWIQRLRDQEEALERQIRSDSERFQGDYPGLDDARSTLKTVREQIDEVLDKLVEGFKTDYELAQANEDRLHKELDELEAGVQDLSHKQLDAKALEQVLGTNRQAYEAFLSQLMETSARSADTVSVIARVVDRAVPEYTPVKPNKRRMVIMGVILALMAGLGIAFMLDRFDNTLKGREDVEERLGIPVLGELLMLKGKRGDGAPFAPATEFTDEPRSSFAESIRTIRTGVALSGLDQSHRSLVVTSTVIGEGKSTLALNLANALGQLGNVLLIDADLRRPSLARLCALEPRSEGLTDLVAGTAKVKACIRAAADNIHVLPAGSTMPPDPLKILSSARFAQVLERLVAAYDSVVIDSPPVELVSDARVLATQASGVVYVIKAGETPHQAVRQCLITLSDTGTQLVGAVLNQIDPSENQAYGRYRYRYSRYGRYSYGQGA